MEARAQARYLRIPPRKARAVDLIRRKHVDEALSILLYPNRAAKMIAKVVQSAAANAENNLELSRSGLYIDRIFVDEGPTYKRCSPGPGDGNPIRKRSSHITVIVKDRKEG